MANQGQNANRIYLDQLLSQSWKDSKPVSEALSNNSKNPSKKSAVPVSRKSRVATKTGARADSNLSHGDQNSQ